MINQYRRTEDTDHSRQCLANTCRRVFTAGEVNIVFTAATSTYSEAGGPTRQEPRTRWGFGVMPMP